MHIETRVIHGGYRPDPETGASTVPISQSTAFAYASAEEMEKVFAGREPGFVYSRMNNPTVQALERRMVVLEEGVSAVACASGMGAISLTMLALLGPGDHVVSGSSIFGGTYSLFSGILARQGIETTFVESRDAGAFEHAVTGRTRVIFVETMGNPRLDVPRLSAISAVARKNGIVLVVDNTVTTPILIRPKECGADIIVHSLSKYVSGHGNAIGGVVVDAGTFDWNGNGFDHLAPFQERAGQLALAVALRNGAHRDLGGCLSAFNAFLLLTGIESLALRMERHCANALEIAGRLSQEEGVADICYPGLPDHPDHVTAREQFGGRYGSLLTLRLESKERAFSFINGLKHVQNLTNLGDAKSLVVHPASTFCRDASEEARRSMGVTDDLVRLSIGLEHVDDIWGDIQQALQGL